MPSFDFDILHVLLYAVFLAGVVGIPLYILAVMKHQLRGTFGRPYVRIVEEMFAEGRRRAELMGRVAELREVRIARLERRLEGGR